MDDALLSAEGVQVEGGRSGPVDLTLRAGDRVGIVGARPEEATRLLQGLARLLRPASGRLLWQGVDVTRRPRWRLPRRLREDVMLIWANPYALFEEDTTIGALVGNHGRGQHDDGRRQHDDGRRARSTTATRARASGLSPGVLAYQVRSLSGVERVRLALAYAEQRRPRVILVDDVFAHLVPESWPYLLSQFDRMMAEDGALLIASRQRQVVEGMAKVVTIPS